MAVAAAWRFLRPARGRRPGPFPGPGGGLSRGQARAGAGSAAGTPRDRLLGNTALPCAAFPPGGPGRPGAPGCGMRPRPAPAGPADPRGPRARNAPCRCPRPLAEGRSPGACRAGPAPPTPAPPSPAAAFPGSAGPARELFPRSRASRGGLGGGERAVSMATALSVIPYFLFYGFSNFEALQAVYRLQKGKVLVLPAESPAERPPRGPPTPPPRPLPHGPLPAPRPGPAQPAGGFKTHQATRSSEPYFKPHFGGNGFFCS